MSAYQLCIPSYRRPGSARKLLNRLVSKGVPIDQTWLFLHEHDEHLEEYRQLVKDSGVQYVIHDGKDLLSQLHLISETFPEGTPVINMDDDVRQVIQRRPAPLNRKQLDEWDSLFTSLFERTAERGLYVWGTKPTTNIQASAIGVVSEGLRFAIGSMHGYFSRPGHPVHDLTVPVKCDYEFSILAYLYDGGLARFEDVAVDADHYDLPGGCVDYRDQAMSLDCSMRLMERYPDLVRWNPTRTKASGHAEISLVNKERNYDGVL